MSQIQPDITKPQLQFRLPDGPALYGEQAEKNEAIIISLMDML